MNKKSSISGLTLVELLVVVTIIGILASILLPVITGQKKVARAKLKYTANRDALMTESSKMVWDYYEASNPSQGRRISEIYFDPSVQTKDLHYMWELIEPQFHLRHRMVSIKLLNFESSDFQDHWMTNMIGVWRGLPYRLEGLQILTLDYTAVTDKGIKHLYSYDPALQGSTLPVQQHLMQDYAMTNLLQISLLKCPNITRKGVADLKKGLPGVVVISNWDPNPQGQIF